MKKNTGKKFVTQGKHREFYLGWNVATLCTFTVSEFVCDHVFAAQLVI